MTNAKPMLRLQLVQQCLRLDPPGQAHSNLQEEEEEPTAEPPEKKAK